MIKHAWAFLIVVTIGIALLGLASSGIADNPATSNSPIVVACVGDSLTAEGSNERPPKGMCYPSQLQGLLGSAHKVENFGHGGGTVLKNGDWPYWRKREYPLALASRPNIVIIMLGTNDSKPQNWVHADEFLADYRELIKSFQALDTHPRIDLCRVPKVVEPNKYKISETVSEIIRQHIDDLAKEFGLTAIRMDVAYGDDLSVLGAEHVHPDAEGALKLAQTAAKVLRASVPTTVPAP